MERNLALLLLAAGLVSPTGCTLLAVDVGGGWADNWSAPAPIGELGRYAGVDVSFTVGFPTLGLCRYSDGDESLWAAYATIDVPFFASVLGDSPCWPMVRPLVGTYFWRERSREVGLLTGLEAGVGVWVSRRWCIVLGYGWLNLHDTVGDEEARVQTARIALVRATFDLLDVGFARSRGPDRTRRIAGVPLAAQRGW